MAEPFETQPRAPLVSSAQLMGNFSSFSSISMQSLSCISLIFTEIDVDKVVVVWLLRRIISLPLVWPFVYRPIEFDRLEFGERVEHTLSLRSTVGRCCFDRTNDDGIEFHSLLAPRFSAAGSFNNGRYSNLVLLLLWYVSCFGECEWHEWWWWWCTFLKQHSPSPCRIKAILFLKEENNKNTWTLDWVCTSSKFNILCDTKNCTYTTFITIPTADTTIMVSASMSKSWYINRFTAK